MTEETLKQAVEVKKRLDSERGIKKDLDNMVEECRYVPDGSYFKLKANIPGTNYEKSVYIHHKTAEMALIKEIENTVSRIRELEGKLADLH